jgi:5'-methylthioadenosine phosphorylase
MEQERPALGIIGGSGIYKMPDLTDIQTVEVDTPFGKPSSPVVVGTLAGKRIAFLARHGIGHTITPSEVNYRANIYALKKLGVERLVSINACGSLREDFKPGDTVIPDQILDFTRGARERSFFGGGLVAHISVADPFCPDLSPILERAVEKAGGTVHRRGTFVIIEGPRFSTKAESNFFRSANCSIIGMTTAPEAFLAREAELCYSVMAHVTDYDVWHTTEEAVSVEVVIRTLQRNAELAQKAIRQLVEAMPAERDCTCGESLANALITRPDAIPPATLEKLDLLVSRYIKR